MNDRPNILDWVEERCAALPFEYQKELERASHILRIRRAGIGGQPLRLFHYTNLESGLQILRTGVFWATDCRFLNDAEERVYAGRVIQGQLSEASMTDVPTVWSKTLAVIGKVRELLVSRMPVYVACFCAADDVASQWRRYADNSQGLVIGLDRRALFEREINASFGLMRIEYDPEAQKEHINGILRMAFAIWEKGVKELGTGRLAELKAVLDVEEWLRFQLLVDAMGMKSPDFRSEQEWRAVAFGSSDESRMDLLHRRRDGMDVPYVELDFKTELGAAGHRLPLRLVRHGPKVPGAAIQVTRDMLNQLGYLECDVG